MSRNVVEPAVFGALLLGALASGTGALVLMVTPVGTANWDLAMLAAGAALLGSAVVASQRIAGFRVLFSKTGGGSNYMSLRHRHALRIGSVLLNLLVAASLFVLVLAILQRMGIVTTDVDSGAMERILGLFIFFLAVNQVQAHVVSLRTHRESAPPGWWRIFSLLTFAVGLGLAFVTIIMALWPERLPFGGPVDARFLALGAHAAMAVSLIANRRLTIFAGIDEDAWRDGSIGMKAVLLPVAIAFALLFLLFFLIVLFGVGVTGVLDKQASPLVFTALVFLAAAFAAVVIVAAASGRARRGADLYRTSSSAKQRQERLLLGGSAAVALLFLGVAAWLFTDRAIPGLQPGHWIHFFSIGALAALGPYGFYVAHEHRRVRRLEERFPDFLRDLAASHRGGLTLTSAITIASRGEYGPLTPEIRKMADQISWNVPFHDALQRFGERVKTPLVQRAVGLIVQADKSGGSTVDVLLAAARDAREIKYLENERRISMSLYTVVVYVTFLVFLVVVAVMSVQFVPEVVAASEAAGELEGPAGPTAGTSTIGVEQYQQFYFFAAVVQALGGGIVAGMIGSGRASLGLRHAFLMMLIVYGAFVLAL